MVPRSGDELNEADFFSQYIKFERFYFLGGGFFYIYLATFLVSRTTPFNSLRGAGGELLQSIGAELFFVTSHVKLWSLRHTNEIFSTFFHGKIFLNEMQVLLLFLINKCSHYTHLIPLS